MKGASGRRGGGADGFRSLPLCGSAAAAGAPYRGRLGSRGERSALQAVRQEESQTETVLVLPAPPLKQNPG